MKRISVFIINGFLDAGKTSFILSTIRRDGFYTQGRTLLLCFEQGETEYDEEELSRYNTKVVYLENESDCNAKNLNRIFQENKADRIVIEMNFLWNQDHLTLPDFFEVNQIITIVDGSTFPVYFSNMRQQFTDAIRQSDVVAFTKLHGDASPLAPFETGLRMTNSQCLYCLIDEQCTPNQQAFDTPLPYDIEADELDIGDKDFGVFYIDTFDRREKYENKIVSFNAWVVRSDKLNDGEFIAGRKVLTCCANDVQLYGFLVSSSLSKHLKDDSWIRIKARCHAEYNETYQEEEIVLDPIEITEIEEIAEPVLDLR